MALDIELKESILNWDEDQLKELCQSALDKKEATPIEIMRIIGDVMQLVGEKFEKEEYMLPELIVASNIVKNTIDEILDPAIRASGQEKESKGKVVIGTVEGDVHSIGKDLVASFLFANGFEIFNIGVDVPAVNFIEKAEEVGAQVIALSSLLTLSMDFQRNVIDLLREKGIRDKYKVVVGGSPTSEGWAEKIGADGWADDALETVNLIKRLLQ
ncbi:MAG: B12-binding domain-containing protein [Candidatus Hermodarchaeota archaeon]